MDLGYLGETLRISHAAGTNPSPRTRYPALERSGIFFESEGGVIVFYSGWRSRRRARDNIFSKYVASIRASALPIRASALFANPSFGTFTEICFTDFERSDFDQSDIKEFLMNEHLTILNIVNGHVDILPIHHHHHWREPEDVAMFIRVRLAEREFIILAVELDIMGWL